MCFPQHPYVIFPRESFRVAVMAGRRSAGSSDPISLYYQGRKGPTKSRGRQVKGHSHRGAVTPSHLPLITPIISLVPLLGPRHHTLPCRRPPQPYPAPFTCSAALATQPLRLHPPCSSSHLHPGLPPALRILPPGNISWMKQHFSYFSGIFFFYFLSRVFKIFRLGFNVEEIFEILHH